MRKRIKCNKIITPYGIVSGYLYINGGKIECVSGEIREADECIDLSDKYLSPGFIDMHTHGAGGYPFLTDSENDIVCGANIHLEHGMTTILPTVSAADIGTMRASVLAIKAAMKSKMSSSNILGAHLEGPYLSAAQAGAQCPKFITPPIESDYMAMIEELGESIARYTAIYRSHRCKARGCYACRRKRMQACNSPV